ncbi:hypothetical protein D3C76_1507240 [compost metagenome]
MLVLTFLIPLTFMVGVKIPVLPRKLSVAGSARVAADVKKWCLRPRCMVPCMMKRMVPTTMLVSLPIKSDVIWKVPFAACRQTM